MLWPAWHSRPEWHWQLYTPGFYPTRAAEERIDEMGQRRAEAILSLADTDSEEERDKACGRSMIKQLAVGAGREALGARHYELRAKS